MFNLMLFLDIARGKPGMLVPVFSSDKTNMPYVQQMDEFLIVKDIIPFLEMKITTHCRQGRRLACPLEIRASLRSDLQMTRLSAVISRMCTPTLRTRRLTVKRSGPENAT